MKYQAVIFDLDGTLLNTLDDLGDSVNEMLCSYGYPGYEMEAYKQMIGNGVANLVARALPQGTPREIEAEALEKFREIYKRRNGEKTRAYSGIAELVTALAEKKIPLAICTNKPQEAAEDIVRATLPSGIFSYIVGDREGMPRKPDPTAILGIAAKLKTAPRQIAYLGDSMVDMQTAVRAGMLPVGVLWGFRERAELEEHGAKILLAAPGELLNIVEFEDRL